MKTYNKKILIVDDTIENLNILNLILEKENFDVYLSKDGYKAIKIAQEIKPDIILLDILMPNIDGYETCKLLKEDKTTKDIPIIFLSALSSPEDKIKAFDVGGIDYISKPFHDKEVLIRVQTHIKTSILIHSLNDLVEKSFHEIYTPLSVIETGLDLQIIEHGNTQYLKSIRAAARLLNVFSDDMYYSIKKEVAPFDPQWIELEPFIQKELLYLKPIILNKNIEFCFKCSVENPMIYINHTELRRLVLNVLSNAIKYAYNNTVINIRIKMQEDKIIFSFSNRGRILSNLDQIFEKLYQEDCEKFGLGIGLEIVAIICKKNNIKINVKTLNNIIKFQFIYKEEE